MSAARYHRAIAGARDEALQLAFARQEALIELLREYATELGTIVARNPAAKETLAEVEALIGAMSNDIATSVGDGVRTTARRIAEMQAEATAALLSSAGLGGSAALGTMAATGVRAAQAVLARPELAEAFVTVRQNATALANRVIRRGVLRGASATAIAKELRGTIVLPGSLVEGDVGLLKDRRRIGYRQVEELGYEPTPENLALVRSEASQIASRAMRIARTETMNAHLEAHIQAAIDSPVVAYIHWKLSYRHDPKRAPCACEIIAENDLYGFGPGIFDPRQTPPRPHPNCFCVHLNILRPKEEWGRPRGPLPALKVDPALIAEQSGKSGSVQRSFVQAIETTKGRDYGITAPPPEPAPPPPPPAPVVPLPTVPTATASSTLSAAERTTAAAVAERRAITDDMLTAAARRATATARTGKEWIDTVMIESGLGRTVKWEVQDLRTYQTAVGSGVGEVAGYFRRSEGLFVMDARYMKELDDLIGRLRAGQRIRPSATQPASIVLHELSHARSITKTNYGTEWGRVLEEGMVERKARKMTRDVFGEIAEGDWSRASVAYPGEIELMEKLATARGDDAVDRLWAVDTAQDRLRVLGEELSDVFEGFLQSAGIGPYLKRQAIAAFRAKSAGDRGYLIAASWKIEYGLRGSWKIRGTALEEFLNEVTEMLDEI